MIQWNDPVKAPPRWWTRIQMCTSSACLHNSKRDNTTIYFCSDVKKAVKGT
ncbi:hypothetical protein DPMN_125463 [Dreissena polymorpha]|uniref:Uncharacterized protein n=1 Tax=Dreissena polymorpha TaxID=45954 RepID=A0A9D4H1G6_DREPO|nr:hypothetical protein DPMN_125463 [Dreissena polymorpha]